MPLVLAIEPDPRQASRLEHLMRTRVGAELIRADTTERALAAIGTRVPDLVLVPSLLSPQEDAALAGALRVIAAAARVQMLTIPLLADPGQPPEARRGLLGRWRRGAARQTAGCDPALFAEQVAAYLAHVRSERLEGADEAGQLEAPTASGAAHAADAMAGDEPARRDAPDGDVAAAAPESLDGAAPIVPVTAMTPPVERAPRSLRARQPSAGSAHRPTNGATITSALPSDEPIVPIEPRRLVAPAAFVKHVRETEILTTPSAHAIDLDLAKSPVVSSSANVVASPRAQVQEARDRGDTIAATDDILQGAGGDYAAAERVEAATASLFAPPDRDGHETSHERTEDARRPLLVTQDAALESVAEAADRTGAFEGLDAGSVREPSDAVETRSPDAEGVDLGSLARGAGDDAGAHLLLCGDREHQEARHEESDGRQGGPAAIASFAGEMSHAAMPPDVDSRATGREHCLLAHDSGLPRDAAPPDRTGVDEGAEGRVSQASSAAETSASLQGTHVDLDAGAARLFVRADRDGRDAAEMHHEGIGGALASRLASGGERQGGAGRLRPRKRSNEDEIDASTVDALIAPLLRELMASRLARTETRATETPVRGLESGDRREQQDARRQESDHDGSATLHVSSRKEDRTPAHGQMQNQGLLAQPRTHAGAPEHEGAGQPAQGSTSAAAEAGHDAAAPAAERSCARGEGEGGVLHRPALARDGDHESARRQERQQEAQAQPLLAGRADEQIKTQGQEVEHLQTEDICRLEASSSARSAVTSPDEIDPMFFVDEGLPDAGLATPAAVSARAPASMLPVLETPDASAAAPTGRSAADAPAAAREPWVELIESLRQDIERLRLEREAAGGPPADRTRPTSRVVTSFDEARSRVRPRITAPQLRMPDPARPNARPTRKRPVQDQWGLFDPEQCGFAALLAKLDEISARDEASA